VTQAACPNKTKWGMKFIKVETVLMGFEALSRHPLPAQAQTQAGNGWKRLEASWLG